MKSTTLVILLLFLIGCGNKKDHSLTENNQDQNTTTLSSDQTTAALNFINAYVKNCNRMQEAAEISAWIDSTQFTTQEFKESLKIILSEADPETGLEADPIFNAQDYPDDGFVVEKFDQENNLVTLRGKSMPDLVVTILLKNENNNWKIDGCGAINPPKQ